MPYRNHKYIMENDFYILVNKDNEHLHKMIWIDERSKYICLIPKHNLMIYILSKEKYLKFHIFKKVKEVWYTLKMTYKGFIGDKI